MSNLSDDDVHRIAVAVAKKMQAKAPDDATILVQKVVQELTTRGLAFVGVDIADKRQIEALKEDLAFARTLRLRLERVGNSMTSAIANAITYGVIALLIIGFVWWLRGQGVTPVSPKGIAK